MVLMDNPSSADEDQLHIARYSPKHAIRVFFIPLKFRRETALQ